MSRIIRVGVFVLLLGILAGCGTHLDHTSGQVVEEPAGLRVHARQNVMVSVDPLGDVIVGSLGEGESATALCFVAHAVTQTGLTGSAVKVRAGRLSGYAAVTDFPRDPLDRQMMFDLDATALRSRLPSCSG